jgi:peptide methionine sulfoxide reductase MsrA
MAPQQTATLAAGCFWRMQDLIHKLHRVSEMVERK